MFFSERQHRQHRTATTADLVTLQQSSAAKPLRLTPTTRADFNSMQAGPAPWQPWDWGGVSLGFRIQQQTRSEADLCASNDQYADPTVESLSRGLTRGSWDRRESQGGQSGFFTGPLQSTFRTSEICSTSPLPIWAPTWWWAHSSWATVWATCGISPPFPKILHGWSSSGWIASFRPCATASWHLGSPQTTSDSPGAVGNSGVRIC